MALARASASRVPQSVRRKYRHFVQRAAGAVRSRGQLVAGTVDGFPRGNRVLAFSLMLAWGARRLAVVSFVLPLAGCGKIIDLDVDYKDCVAIHEQRYVEEFHGSTTISSLRDRCWKT